MKQSFRILLCAMAAVICIVHWNFSQTSQTDTTLQKAKTLYQSIERMDVNTHNGTPRSVRGTLAKNINLSDVSQAKQFLKSSKTLFKINESTDDFTMKKSFKDNQNMTHTKLQQTYKGVSVFGSELILHGDATNTVVEVNGRFTPALSLDVTPSVTSDGALNIALADLGAAEYRWQNAEQEKIIKEVYHDNTRTWKPAPELVIAPKNGDFNNGEYRLSWKMMIAVDGAKRGNWEYWIDAQTGVIINKFNSMPDAVGTGVSNYNGTVTINTKWNVTNYLLYDTIRSIKTYSAGNGTTLPGTLLTDNDNYWDQNKAAVDAQWGAEKVFDFYYNIFGRNSFDNAGSQIISSVNYSTSYDNAFWNGSQMVYGDGDGTTFSSLTSIDICGHELTHAVTQYSAGLVYQGESGALNEAMSDIMGTAIEFYATPAKANWLIGEECYTPNISGDALRYMNNPNLGNQPDTYYGTDWASTSGSDYGGVHTNSGVLNFAFYLMTVGGSGTNDNSVAYSVIGAGIEATRAIAYRALTVYFSTSTDYAAARTGFLSAAADLYGSTSSQYKAVYDAFGAVGVGVQLTAINSFDAGTIKVNGATKNSGFTYYVSSGETQTYEAIPQYYNPYQRVWNTSGASASISNWWKTPYNGSSTQIQGATNISYSFTASTSDNQATYIADLKSQYNIALSTGTRIDGGNGGAYKLNGTNVGASYSSTIIQGNNVTVEAVPSSGDIFYQWSNSSTTNPYSPPEGNVSLTANYKGIHLSSTASTFSNNSQRKIVRTHDGWYHQVYESAGHVWLEESTDGFTWFLGNNGQPLDNGGGKCPSIDWHYNPPLPNDSTFNAFVVVYQQPYSNTYTIQYKIFRYYHGSYVYNPTSDCGLLYTEPSGGDSYSTSANPNIAWGNGYSFVLCFERKSTASGMQPGIYWKYGTMYEGGVTYNPTPTNPQLIAGTTSSSTSATIDLNKQQITDCSYFYIVYQPGNDNGSNIMYMEFHCYSNGSSFVPWPLNNWGVASSGSGYLNYNPSMVQMPGNDDNIRVCWIRDMYGSGSATPNYVNAVYWSSTNPSVFTYSGNNVKSISLNIKDNSSDTYYTYAQYASNYVWQNTVTDGSSFYGAGTIGQYVQLSNGPATSSMLVSSFYTSSLPYWFGNAQLNKRNNLTKESASDSSIAEKAGYGRGMNAIKGTMHYEYSLKNLLVNNSAVKFMDIPASFNHPSGYDTVKNKRQFFNQFSFRHPKMDTINKVLLSEPFSISNGTSIAFDEESGFIDSAAALNTYGKNEYLSYKVELVDPTTYSSLGTIKQESYNAFHSKGYAITSFKSTLKKLSNKSARIKITFDTNIDSLQTSVINEYTNLNDYANVNATSQALSVVNTVTTTGLSDAYPNPFNPTTQIQYQLPANARVTLKIFDVLGREVAVLVDGMKSAGSYTANFDGSRLASGMYFARLIVNPSDGSKPLVQVKKMLMLK